MDMLFSYTDMHLMFPLLDHAGTFNSTLELDVYAADNLPKPVYFLILGYSHTIITSLITRLKSFLRIIL